MSAVSKNDLQVGPGCFPNQQQNTTPLQSTSPTLQELTNSLFFEYSEKNFRRVIDCYTHHTELFENDPNVEQKSRVYQVLGCAHASLESYLEATLCFKKGLKLARQHQLNNIVVTFLDNIGNVCAKAEDFERAKKYHRKFLELAKAQKNQELFLVASGHLMQDLTSANDLDEALHLNEELLKQAASVSRETARIYSERGNIFFAQHKDTEALDCHKQDLEISLQTNYTPDLWRAYGNLGSAYRILGQYDKALESHKNQLKIAKKLEQGKVEALARAYFGLGMLYLKQSDYIRAEKQLGKCIQQEALIKKELVQKSEWQITFFEEQAKTYTVLERILIKQEKEPEALQVTESRRSQALNATLAINLQITDEWDTSIQEMKELARKQHTTFIVYALVDDALIATSSKLFAWVISADAINSISLPTECVQSEMGNIAERLKEFPFNRSQNDQSIKTSMLNQIRKIGGGEEIDENLDIERQKFKEDLKKWYNTLILPLEEHLEKVESLTFIPDGFLSQLPFALLIDLDDKYLIERFPVSTLPSFKTLMLQSKVQHISLSESVVVMGNPDTGRIKDALPNAEKEAQIVGKLFSLSPECILKGEQATPQHIKAAMQNARFIFLSCHGLDKKPGSSNYSVFEGCLLLAPDPEHPQGYLDSKEIAKLNLTHTEFVCLSACFSGTGGLWQEGSVGLVRSFITAGAKTVMAAHWPVRDSEITISMIEKMAKNMIERKESRLTHQQALQRIMKEMIAEYPEQIEEWGVFFLTGIN